MSLFSDRVSAEAQQRGIPECLTVWLTPGPPVLPQMVTRLDELGASSRLFTQPISAAGSSASFDPFPAEWAATIASSAAGGTAGGLLAPQPPSAGGGVAPSAPGSSSGRDVGGIHTQFVALAFNPYTTAPVSATALPPPPVVPASGDGSAAPLPAMPAPAVVLSQNVTRLRLLDPVTGAEIQVNDSSAPPLTFTIPAAAVPHGTAGSASCNFFDPATKTVSSAGCAALPSPKPPAHEPKWLPPAQLRALFGNALDIFQQCELQAPTSPNSSSPPPTPAAATPPPPASGAPSCTATPVTAGPATNVSATQGAALLSSLWNMAGPLLCNCKVTLLSCEIDAELARAAVAAAAAAGLDAVAAAAAARTRIFLDPLQALSVPSVGCARDDATTVMKIFHGTGCAMWNTSNSFGCWWDAVKQARASVAEVAA